MSRALVNALAATLPGTVNSDPWGGGHDCWKVGGKMFANIGAHDDYGVDLKCADVETAQLVIEMGHGLRAPYAHASWIRVTWGLISDDELRDRVLTSYRIIRSGLPKKVQAALGP